MLHSSVIARFRPTKEMGERASERAEKRKREREVYRVAELAQQIGINGDKLSWPVIDEAHRP